MTKGKPAGLTPMNAKLHEQNNQTKVAPIVQVDGMAQRLRAARMKASLSISDLHKKTGISRTAIHGYESGKTKPGAKEIIQLSEVFGETPNWLLCGTEEPLKKRTGLSSLASMKEAPHVVLGLLMVLAPTVFAILNEDELASILTLIDSMIEGKNPKLHRYLTESMATIVGIVGDGSTEKMAAFSKLAQDPSALAEIQEKMAKIASELGLNQSIAE